jgi:hypothetical protein
MRRTVRSCLWCFGLAALLVAAGCGKRSYVFNDSVEGTLKLNGVPLPSVRVEFVPEAEPGGEQAPLSTGFTDEQGRYRLTHDDQKPGAVLGKHRVVLHPGRGGAPAGGDDREARAQPRAPAPKVPPAYTIAANTPLQVTVTKEQHTYDLNVTGR